MILANNSFLKFACNLHRYKEKRHIENFMLDYSGFLARLNALSSNVSVSSEVSMLSQASQGSQVPTDHTANFESSPEYVKQQRDVKTWITKNIELLMKMYPPMSTYAPTSRPGRTRQEDSIYAGCGGNAYLHWKLTRFFEAEGEMDKAEIHKKNAILAVEVALSMLPPRLNRGDGISFYMGSAGMYCHISYYVFVVLEWIGWNPQNIHLQLYIRRVSLARLKCVCLVEESLVKCH